ncbi:hypothetical protein H1C71_018634, partial [Ictidomys tridecemlineatus]
GRGQQRGVCGPTGLSCLFRHPGLPQVQRPLLSSVQPWWTSVPRGHAEASRLPALQQRHQEKCDRHMHLMLMWRGGPETLFAKTMEQRVLLPGRDRGSLQPPAELPWCVSPQVLLPRKGWESCFKGNQEADVINRVCCIFETRKMVRPPVFLLPAPIKPSKAYLCPFDVGCKCISRE